MPKRSIYRTKSKRNGKSKKEKKRVKVVLVSAEEKENDAGRVRMYTDRANTMISLRSDSLRMNHRSVDSISLRAAKHKIRFLKRARLDAGLRGTIGKGDGGNLPIGKGDGGNPPIGKGDGGNPPIGDVTMEE